MKKMALTMTLTLTQTLAQRAVGPLMVLLLALLLGACASVPQPGALPDGRPATVPDDALWSAVLQRHVDEEGRVDFSAIAAAPADLNRYVAQINRVSPASHAALFPTPQAVLAYHINAYNALAMHRVIEGGIPASLAGFAKFGFFHLRKVAVGGEAISLYDYENKVIRALGEARVHFALNCMSVGCPRLPREAFVAERLDAQLEREARLFLSETRNVAVDDAGRVLKLSEIFDFYTGDFLAGAPSLAAYVNRYRDFKVPEDYRVDFIPYDWTIKRRP